MRQRIRLLDVKRNSYFRGIKKSALNHHLEQGGPEELGRVFFTKKLLELSALVVMF